MTHFNPNHFVLDPRANSVLRASAKQDQAAALKEAARQFEGLMLQALLKGMRDATPSNGLLDSDQTRFFMSILDQQLAQNLAATRPIGFAAMIERQLGVPLDGAVSPDFPERAAKPLRGMEAFQGLSAPRQSMPTERIPAIRGREGHIKREEGVAGVKTRNTPSEGEAFVRRIWPHAQKAAQMLGVPPHFVVAHSALESGWGQHEIRRPNGSPSYNLFGVKAGKNWKGPSVETWTTEYENGVPGTVRAKFRAYASYAEAFRDYAELLRGKARFAQVLGQRDGAEFARSLQDSGYATDPLYADKLGRIIQGATLKQALSG